MSDDGEIQVTDEENALETKMENINNSILSKIVDGAEIGCKRAVYGRKCSKQKNQNFLQ